MFPPFKTSTQNQTSSDFDDFNICAKWTISDMVKYKESEL